MTVKVTLSSFILVLLLVVNSISCANILTIFCTPSQSHVILGNKLNEGLLKKGHHVTFVSPYRVEPMENLTHYNLRSIHKYKEIMAASGSTTDTSNIYSMFQHILQSTTMMNKLFWDDPVIKKLIEDRPKYDLVIMLSFFHDAVLGFGPYLGAPTIVFSCIGSNSIYNNYVANPTMVYSKNMMLGIPTDSFWGRLVTVTANMLMNAAISYQTDGLNQELLDKNFPNSPSLRDLQKNVSIVLANSHFSIEPARPYVPNMIQIGGFHVQNTKPLVAEYKKFLDKAKQGAILFSLGSNIQIAAINEEKQKAILKVLGEMAPIRVIFKSELKYDNLAKNIMVKPWVPQADILAHPNIKLFISHGGLGGITESVYHGVPILGLPFYDDQIMNAKDAQMAGYAEVIQIDDVTETLFREVLKGMLNNSRYSNNVKIRSTMMREQPVQPLDNAVFWIEHVLKFGGGSHLQNAGVDLQWYQLYMLDIYVFYTVVLVFLALLFIFTIQVLTKIWKKLKDRIKNLNFCEQKIKIN